MKIRDTVWRNVEATQYVDVTSSITAVKNTTYWVDTSGAARTVTLPSTAVQGDTIRFFDVKNTFNTNALTVARNGHVIQGDAADMTVDSQGASFGLIYHNATNGWRIFTV